MGMDFREVEKYLDKIEITADLLEIGIGDSSTGLFSNIAASHQKTLHSVDINTQNVEYIERTYKSGPVKFYNLKGEDFLDQHTDLKFSIVLLDNFDWDFVFDDTSSPYYEMIKDQQIRYKESFQLEMTNINSQIAHLTQAIKLTNMISEQCIVICDDTFLTGNQTYDGKCGAAVPYLMTLGFTPYIESNGIVMVRTNKKDV